MTANQSSWMTAAVLASLGAVSLYAASLRDVPRQSIADVVKTSSEQQEYPLEIKQELFARIQSFFGEEGLQKLQNSFVVVKDGLPSSLPSLISSLSCSCVCIYIYCVCVGGGIGRRRFTLCSYACSLWSESSSSD